MKQPQLYVFLFFVSIALSSCYTTSFLPQTHNVPLFTKENQIRINPSHSFRTFDLQLAYAPINHLGIIANTHLTSRYNMTELGFGGFQSYDDKLILETYAGFGLSRFKAEITTHSRTPLGFNPIDDKEYVIDIYAHKYFLQQNFGLKFNEKNELAFSLKGTFWYFPKYYYDYEEWEYQNYSGTYRTLKDKDSVNVSKGSAITLEPAITFKTGGEHTKFMVQTGICLPGTTDPIYPAPYRHTYAYIRVGISVNFGLLFPED